MLTRNFFNHSLRRRVLSTLVDASPASLKVHVWHAGRVSNDQAEFIRMPQKEVLYNLNPDDNISKMPHASCELTINFNHADTPSCLRDIAKSMLVTSDEYLYKQAGNQLSMEKRKQILQTYESIKLDYLSIYLSWYPDASNVQNKNIPPVHINNFPQINDKVTLLNTYIEWINYVFSKCSPRLANREELVNSTILNLQSIELNNINYEAILLDLSRFIIFKYNEDNNSISALKPFDESRYFVIDILNDHVDENKINVFSSEHVCSTLVARVLRNGLGFQLYSELVEEAKQKLGHKFAYPELVYEVAALARLREQCNHIQRPINT